MIHIHPFNKKALSIATISFGIGTLILLFFLISGAPFLILLGFYYVIIALIINSITLLGLIINAILYYQHYKENLAVIAIFLLNIPIAIGYVLIVDNNSFHRL